MDNWSIGNYEFVFSDLFYNKYFFLANIHVWWTILTLRILHGFPLLKFYKCGTSIFVKELVIGSAWTRELDPANEKLEFIEKVEKLNMFHNKHVECESTSCYAKLTVYYHWIHLQVLSFSNWSGVINSVILMPNICFSLVLLVLT